MPCLNEAETLAACIEKARIGIDRSGVPGEIVVADNGSKDDSVLIAEKLGARVVHVKEKGYGNALRRGIEAASGKWIVMGDADESYDFSETDRFVKKFREGLNWSTGAVCHEAVGKFCRAACPLLTRGWGIRSFREWRSICSLCLFTMFTAASVGSRANCTSAWNFSVKGWNLPLR